MHGSQTTDGNTGTLRRIAAVLLALAGLAEHAAQRSAPVRRLVLWLLAPGEAIAREFVAGLDGACECYRHAPAPIQTDDSAEAIRLALSFRALAAVVATFADIIARRRPAVAPAAFRSPAVSGGIAMWCDLPAEVGRRDSS